MGWRPIEAEGFDFHTEVVLACEYGVCTAANDGFGWYLQTGGMEPTSLYDDRYFVQQPTHWMPLPEPPLAGIETGTAETEGFGPE